MAADVNDILEEYDDLTKYVAYSTHDIFSGNIRRWLSFLDNTPAISSVVHQIEHSLSFEEWSKTGLVEQEGMGYGKVDLPEATDSRLGALLGIFRQLAEDDDSALNFAHSFASSSTNLDENINDLVRKYFDPLATDLRRRLRRELLTSQVQVPASDRVVSIDHNAPAYTELEEALEQLERDILAINDYDDPDDKDQRVAEISAGRRLLKAARARLDALMATLGVALKYLAKKFGDNALGKVITWVIEKLIALAPAIWKFFAT